MAFDDLSAIRKKVRRLTRSPAESQLNTNEIDDYINTFLVYDLPQRIQTMELRRNLALFTNTTQERYNRAAITMSQKPNNANPRRIGRQELTFDNDITFIDKPIYIAGRQAYVTQSREDFYNIHPHTNEVRDTGLRGDGIQTQFIDNLTGATLQDDEAILPRSVTLSVQAINGATLAVYDDGNGNLVGDISGGTNAVNYNTGVFDVSFLLPPANGAEITAEFSRERLTRPDTVLLYNNTMYVRPLPDKAYRIEFEAQVRPVKLLEQDDETEIRQWWQYVAYGAAKKVFEDRMDMESVALIQPEMDTQERLALRSTLLQAKKERAGTIYASAYEGYGHGHDGVM